MKQPKCRQCEVMRDENYLARAIAIVETAERSPYDKAFRLLRKIRDDETYNDAFKVICEWDPAFNVQEETGLLRGVDE